MAIRDEIKRLLRLIPKVEPKPEPMDHRCVSACYHAMDKLERDQVEPWPWNGPGIHPAVEPALQAAVAEMELAIELGTAEELLLEQHVDSVLWRPYSKERGDGPGSLYVVRDEPGCAWPNDRLLIAWSRDEAVEFLRTQPPGLYFFGPGNDHHTAVQVLEDGRLLARCQDEAWQVV